MCATTARSRRLLAAIPPARLEAVETDLATLGVPAWRVGRVDSCTDRAGEIVLAR